MLLVIEPMSANETQIPHTVRQQQANGFGMTT
jgi:hypothetical protein